MITYKFSVLVEEIPTHPELPIGTPVIPVTHEIVPGGYELRVWRRLDNKMPAKVPVEYNEHFRTFTVEGETPEDADRLMWEKCEEIKRDARGRCGCQKS